MKRNKPSQLVKESFSVFGQDVRLTGGQGECYRVENVVFKPVDNVVEAAWLADLNMRLSEKDAYRVPKPLNATGGSWIFDNWTASEFVEGEHSEDRLVEIMELCKVFHRDLSNICRPDWLDKRENVFDEADKMAWGELPLPNFEYTQALFNKISLLLKEVNLPNQIVHGDWGPEQILFHDSMVPAVLDITPYYRPADYPIADMLISAIVNQGKDTSILELGKDIDEFGQLLLRAFLFRLCTYVCFQIHPENNFDWTFKIDEYLKIADELFEFVENL